MKNNLPATKADLEKFITKKEFKIEVAKLATKEELKAEVAKLATKKELKSEIAKINIKLEQTEKNLRTELKNTEKTIRAEARLDLDDFRQEINEKLNLLPTKDEFFTKMDEIMGELQTIREEHTISSHQLSNHDDRITVLENTVGIVVV